jgi:hypothetical protein
VILDAAADAFTAADGGRDSGAFGVTQTVLSPTGGRIVSGCLSFYVDGAAFGCARARGGGASGAGGWSLSFEGPPSSALRRGLGPLSRGSPSLSARARRGRPGATRAARHATSPPAC